MYAIPIPFPMLNKKNEYGIICTCSFSLAMHVLQESNSFPIYSEVSALRFSRIHVIKAERFMN